MYGHKARESIVAVLKDEPELSVRALKPAQLRKIADRLLIELWMRGFQVSARTVGKKAPKAAPDPKAWRDAKLAPKPKRRPKQADVETAASEDQSSPPPPAAA